MSGGLVRPRRTRRSLCYNRLVWAEKRAFPRRQRQRHRDSNLSSWSRAGGSDGRFFPRRATCCTTMMLPSCLIHSGSQSQTQTKGGIYVSLRRLKKPWHHRTPELAIKKGQLSCVRHWTEHACLGPDLPLYHSSSSDDRMLRSVDIKSQFGIVYRSTEPPIRFFFLFVQGVSQNDLHRVNPPFPFLPFSAASAEGPRAQHALP